MLDISKIQETYEVLLPDTIDSNIYNFKMSTLIEGKTFVFHFKYFSNRWNCYFTIDAGLARDVGVYPYVISNVAYTDYAIYFIFDGDMIAKGDLQNCKIGIIKWRQ
jgi:hypothetical protein